MRREREQSTMPGVLKEPRIDAARSGKVVRYLGYAVGEIALIFVGITLAIAFENSNERRRSAEAEADVLSTIQEDLAANLVELERNIAFDQSVIGSIEVVRAHLATHSSWRDSLNDQLGLATRWSSPFLAASGYTSLRSRGVQLVSSPSLRRSIVDLYENTYARLTGDADRTQWAFQESVWYPLIVRELDMVEDDNDSPYGYYISDYAATRGSGELDTTLGEHRQALLMGVAWRQEAHEETAAVIGEIGRFLEGGR